MTKAFQSGHLSSAFWPVSESKVLFQVAIGPKSCNLKFQPFFSACRDFFFPQDIIFKEEKKKSVSISLCENYLTHQRCI